MVGPSGERQENRHSWCGAGSQEIRMAVLPHVCVKAKRQLISRPNRIYNPPMDEVANNRPHRRLSFSFSRRPNFHGGEQKVGRATVGGRGEPQWEAGERHGRHSTTDCGGEAAFSHSHSIGDGNHMRMATCLFARLQFGVGKG